MDQKQLPGNSSQGQACPLLPPQAWQGGCNRACPGLLSAPSVPRGGGREQGSTGVSLGHLGVGCVLAPPEENQREVYDLVTTLALAKSPELQDCRC